MVWQAFVDVRRRALYHELLTLSSCQLLWQLLKSWPMDRCSDPLNARVDNIKYKHAANPKDASGFQCNKKLCQL